MIAASPVAASALVGWLQQEWLKPTRLTTIPQAMAAHGFSLDGPLRWAVTVVAARHWRSWLTETRRAQWPEHPDRLADFQRQLKTWRFASLALSTEERLAGKAVVALGESPSIAAIADSARLSAADAARAADALRRVGFLEDDAPDGIRLANDHRRRFLSGLGLSFHTVERPATGERFNTTCAIDYVVLARNAYPGERLALFDACAHCFDRLHAVYDANRVIEATPVEPVLYRGGPCGQNLLFTNMAHLQEWLGASPDPRKAATLTEWLGRWGRQ